ncbi:UDP-N-acetylglucosamine--N-acetylmuramyl-(pentapeptide) pyrophosphoryl-undecaprenol N-acetylglucosamine transferase [Aminivibrio sp.]|jgi:UDP-N-acetylglucosamine--N-acetylmuramyl-(pentapeptide) pyrophosphoryl-undecaprenol N-acetylglucosamine transferase|uniref:UDP-N-acetylglucosamine--N-acetylmuramyl- (pentapeptide) pyrophosphoryl-undecaprenol N-acetylglucosamine transferase n=1 Tax=Aminivibrio sp. TaxID=1872489 RepID=UPI001A4F4EA7|nr:UDP-N-acetylglucosamine--N-acetylmuramyl-(pentapeptide) pyrophosphoryl-undecaprenol N-acetylglucosamine transferase [Aminivibrio sp.]MBL3538906.1 UDP-N-acetylglucosamine--N-acetylmuramyl-(pentapeptide) pyrophosphoryl-undecaprenol N-acetylglucosamine transferase [Aminivibrio sp.]
MTKLCLVAGGTGGHIFPALAFAEWLLASGTDVTLSFVCGSRPLEKEIYASKGIVPLCLPLSGSPFGAAGIGSRILRWKETLSSFFVFRDFLRKEECDCCLLFGGYVSFVPLLSCHLGGIPLIVHEQNAVAGKVTRLAFRLKKKIASGWGECLPFAEGTYTPTGVPVRSFSPRDPGEAWPRLGTGRAFPQKPIIGVLGGSLMSERLIQLLGYVIRDEVLQKCTFLFLGASQQVQAGLFSGDRPENVLFVEKQWDMTDFFSVIDGAVARGGASTLSELMLWGIPTVVVPWKQAADNHQEKNAECFERIASGEIWREDEPLEFLKEKILRVLRKAQNVRKEFSEGDESERLWRLISSSIGREITNFG